MRTKLWEQIAIITENKKSLDKPLIDKKYHFSGSQSHISCPKYQVVFLSEKKKKHYSALGKQAGIHLAWIGNKFRKKGLGTI